MIRKYNQFVFLENPYIKSSHIILFVFWIYLLQPINAQTRDQKSVYWQLGVGNTYLYDNYLSPLPHTGISVLFSNGNMKPLKWGLPDSAKISFDDVKWFSRCNYSINPVYGQSSTGSTLLYGNIDLRKSILRQIVSDPKYHISTGAFAALSGGGRYSIHNGNNPASLDAMFDLGITVFSDYKFTFWKKSMIVSYQGSMAMVGLAFSPEYAESYYEIFYLSNHKNIIKFTNPINKQHWRQQLSLNIPISGRKSSFRVSYWNEGRISLFNNIRTRVLSNHFSVGYISYFSIL
ncbi:MAG: hypothetical protein M0P26_02725 [Bacteroidales bacterium]|nr:hypothetical protein [Bacteroidales bacterium]